MASQRTTNSSRLAEMQMRFQQKQLQEREQKRAELIEGAFLEAKAPAVTRTVANGKVRQMFDERRRGAGIDRSNPLKPIAAGGNAKVKAAVPIKTTTSSTSTFKRPVYGGIQQTTMMRQSNANANFINKSRFTGFDEMDNLDDETLPKGFSSISLNGDRNNNKMNAKSSNIKLKPVEAKKTPTGLAARSTRQAPSMATTSAGYRTKYTSERSPISPAVKTSMRIPAGSAAPSSSKLRTESRNSAVPPGMGVCHFCGRHFAEDRLAKHEQVCQKVISTKRKVFDATKHRVKGTEAEKYVSKPMRGGASRGDANSSGNATRGNPPSKNNWRKQHDEFIAAIRAAKQVQAHLKSGGKLSDLPPPPPSENPDYIQCPHCNRRFNQAAAERHIPRCATMIHNKPKPALARKR